MTDAWSFLATKQAYDSLGKMASYIRANNPGVSETDALLIATVAAHYFQPVTEDSYITKRVKDWGKALADPDKWQELQDEREHKRNAPIERAYRQHLNDIRLRDLRNHLGPNAPERRSLPSDRAVDVGRSLVDIIKRRRQDKPLRDKQRQTEKTVNDLNEQAAEYRKQKANQPVEVDSEGTAQMPDREV